MDLKDIQRVFNRAFERAMNLKKNAFVFFALAACGLLIIFFQGLSIGAGPWIGMSLTFLPIFLCVGAFLGIGILLIRIYHHEIKGKEISYRDILSKSWEIAIGAAYFSIPLAVAYLVLWMGLGIFFLLTLIPGLGEFLGAVLSFAPFLINLGTLFLCVFSLSLLFFVSPILALKGLNRAYLSDVVFKRFKSDVFSHVLLIFIGVLPLLTIGGLLILAGALTGAVCPFCDNPLSFAVQRFFIMIPFAALISPSFIFFFNFAGESHVLLMKKMREQVEN